MANLKPFPATGCGPHGVHPASKCNECNRERLRKWRRKNGVRPAQKGCKKHGNPRGCKECSRERSERYNRRRGVKKREVHYCEHGVALKYRASCLGCNWRPSGRQVGCTPHGIPYHLCLKCKAEDARNYRKRERETRERERARLSSYAQWEAEQLGRPDAEQKLLERAVRDNAHGKEAQEALERLNTALMSVESPCKGDPSYADGTFTREEAKAKCVDCPVLELCEDYGRAAKREYKRRGYRLSGIYGGIRAEDLR